MSPNCCVWSSDPCIWLEVESEALGWGLGHKRICILTYHELIVQMGTDPLTPNSFSEVLFAPSHKLLQMKFQPENNTCGAYSGDLVPAVVPILYPIFWGVYDELISESKGVYLTQRWLQTVVNLPCAMSFWKDSFYWKPRQCRAVSLFECNSAF